MFQKKFHYIIISSFVVRKFDSIPAGSSVSFSACPFVSVERKKWRGPNSDSFKTRRKKWKARPTFSFLPFPTPNKGTRDGLQEAHLYKRRLEPVENWIGEQKALRKPQVPLLEMLLYK